MRLASCARRPLGAAVGLLAAAGSWTGRQAGKARAEEGDDEARFRASLRERQRRMEELKAKWDYENETSRLPTKSWPLGVPDSEEIPRVSEALDACGTEHKGNSEKFLKHCGELQFGLASALMSLQDDGSKVLGAKLYRDLAMRGHADGTCGYAICLRDGRGVPECPAESIKHFRAACSAGHAQSQFELAVGHYNGDDGLDMDETKAVELFRMAAEQNHTGAMYMLGDCLLEGIGCARCRVEALDWLLKAGEQGHRASRSRYLALIIDQGQELEGNFTDSSRQSVRQ